MLSKAFFRRFIFKFLIFSSFIKKLLVQAKHKNFLTIFITSFKIQKAKFYQIPNVFFANSKY